MDDSKVRGSVRFQWAEMFFLFTLALGAFAMPSPPASAQKFQEPSKEKGKKETPPQAEYGTNIVLVNTTLTVTDGNGRFISDLEKDDFTVLEDGAPQKIAEFGKESSLPLKFALLLDRSESVRGRFMFEQEAAGQFLSAIMRYGGDQGLVAAFDSNVFLLQDFTPNRKLLEDAVRKLSVAGGTSLLDSIYKVCRDKFLTGDVESRRVILLITDGEDTTSRATADQTLRMALSAGVVVFAIGVDSGSKITTGEHNGHELLRKLCQQTGGAVFFLDEKEERLAPLYQKIEIELRNQYSIGYYSANPVFDGRYHTITIKTKNGDHKIHARRGYYASKL